MPTKRTTHRSASGKKLYAVRDSKGRFKDIQSYKRSHAQDMKRTSKAEAAKKAKAAAMKTKKVVKKTKTAAKPRRTTKSKRAR